MYAIRSYYVQVIVRLFPEDIEARANNVLMQQVLVNLIGNGVHAIEETEKKEIAIEARIVGDKVVILVTDTGPGIAAEDLPHIFDPFFTTKKSGQGLGLGLTISERILKEMRGNIRVVPQEEGRGACFRNNFV